MKLISFYSNRVFRLEEKASSRINIVSHYDDETLLDKSGKLIKIIKLSGLNFIGKDELVLDQFKKRRNNLIKNLSSSFGLYFWQIRTKINLFPEGQFKSNFSNIVNDKYKNKIENMDMFHTEHYLAIISKQPEGMINKGMAIIHNIFKKFDKEAKKTYLLKSQIALNEATQNILNTFCEYHPIVLSVYENKGVKFSAPLEMLTKLVNYDFHRVPLCIQDSSRAIPKQRIFFSNKLGTIELRSADNSKKFSAVLAIKEYSPITYQGILDGLNTLRVEYIITQSFCPYDRQVAKNKQRDHQKEMMQTKDVSSSQTEEINEVFDETASGEVGYGSHHLTVACFAESQDKLNQNISLIVSAFSDVDIVCVREDVACEMGFWAQLPGNFGYIARKADISSKNIAGFASLHNYPIGKLNGNHWGNAVTVFETLSGSPYFFNFHYKDVGNFLVFGAMGSGKTVLVGFLILQSLKFGGKRVIFDKDRGLEILVRALNGTYEVIMPGKPTGFNPCLLEDTSENRKFLSQLFRKMLSRKDKILDESELTVIEKAIDGMYRLEPRFRQLCHIASLFGAKKTDSLRARFDQWHSEGANAWLFDHATDSLNLNNDVLGFDIGHILSDEECKTPALMYLIYQNQKSLEGQRGVLFCDEGWLALNDEYFQILFNDLSRTPRKKNNIFGLATQTANDIVHSSISKSINESAFCKFFFPNPSADRHIYIDELGLTESEYQLVKTMPDDQHAFLLIHGRGVNKQTVVARLNLKGLEDEVAIISAREETLTLLDSIRKEVGDDANQWLPIFYQRRKALSVEG